jgi:hypothetical protein
MGVFDGAGVAVGAMLLVAGSSGGGAGVVAVTETAGALVIVGGVGTGL